MMATSPAQLIEQATRHASHLERLKSSEYARIKSLLGKQQDELLAMLAREDITAWTRTRAERQLAAVRDMLARGYSSAIIPALSQSVASLAEYEAGFEARSLQKVAPAVSFTIPTGAQVTAAVYANPLLVNGPDGGSLLESFIDDWSRSQVRSTVNSIRMGYALGETTSQVLRRVNEQTIPMEQRGLRALVHTTLQHTATMARQQTWEANRDIIKGVRWLSTLDSKTSDLCRALDNQVFPVDKGPRPPAHVNCRSTTIAVLDDRFAFLEKGGTRAARDPETGDVESVGAKTSYYSWLKKQPADVQDSIIGPTRGQLLRNGGLSAQRFAELQLGKNFMPLTTNARGETPIEQMRKMEPVAFSRAGI